MAKRHEKTAEQREEATAPEAAPAEKAEQAREEATPGPRGPVRPWFAEDRGLGIAGTARKPGAPGTKVTGTPEIRVVKVDRATLQAQRPTPAAAREQAEAAPRAAWPARLGHNTPRPAPTGTRTVRHVGTATRTGLELEPAAAVAQPAPARAPAPAATKRAEQPAPSRAPAATATKRAEQPVAQPAPAPAPAAKQADAPAQPAAAPADQESRPVVRVSLSQAAAAGGQTLRPLAPTQRTTVATVARPVAVQPAAAEKKRREAPPVVPLAIPDADATFLAVEGLGTPACAARVERALRGLPGVAEVEANLAAGIVAVAPNRIDRAAIDEALAGAGHPARAEAPDAAAARREAMRLGLFAGATAGAGLASQAAAWAGSAPLSLALAAAGLATSWPLLRTALGHVVRGRFAAEIVPVAASVATLLASWLAPGPTPALAVLPLAFHLAVAALARRAGARALGIIEHLRAGLPAGDARPGTRLEVGAGQVIPADGRLLGPALLDERAVGGEDDVQRLPGEAIAAGTVAQEGGAAIEVTASGARSRIARGLRVAERALATHPVGTPAQLASSLLVPLALAAGIAAGALQGPWAAAAVLAGAAPLSFALAAALASAAGVTRAAGRGVAVRSSEALDRAGKVRVVLLDKTTTLTRGDAAVLELLVKPGRDAGEVLAAAAAAQEGIDHGIARALAAHARDLDLAIPKATERRHAPGQGVRARVGGHLVTVGSAHYATRCGIDPGLLVQPVDELARRGRTPLLIAFDEEAVAVLGIADTPRESARQAMGSLELLGLDLRVASGDATASVQWLTEAIGLDRRVARGDLSPEGKKALVEELRAAGPCLVAGASPVDAEALAAADLAVAAGTDPAVEAAAGALLVRQDPQGVVELVRAGRATRRGRRLATAAGLVGNAATMGLAALGEVGVAGAAALALVTSLLALGAAASPWVRMR